MSLQQKLNARNRLPPRTYNSMNIIIRKKQTKKDLAIFLHAVCFAPIITTFVKAIRNNQFNTWPGLDPKLITQHLPVSEATIKDHMTRERINLQSTKPKSTLTLSSVVGIDSIALK